MPSISVTDKTKKYFGPAIIIYGLLLALLEFTQYRGWGWPNMVAPVLNLLPFVDTNATNLYRVEEKVLAHTFDVLLGIFLIVVGLMIRSMIHGGKTDNHKVSDEHPICTLNKDDIKGLTIEIRALRNDVKRYGRRRYRR